MTELPLPDGSGEAAPTGEKQAGTLGRYKILDELGRGGCGVVYRALDPSIGRVIAIKTILAGKESSGQESRERFRREARSAGMLSHPNIVTVHDFSDSGDPMFIAMEFVEGRTLAEQMSKGCLALEFVVGVLRSASDALDYAHAHRIVHRDVKPANFLITESGRLKITDFGIAKILDNQTDLTSAGMIVGTAQYMSPEQIAEAPLTGRSDQFSLAVIAYEMLAGVKPFQGNSWASVIHAIIEARPPHIATYRNSLGEPVNGVLQKALSKAPESRYATCSEFCDALEHAILGATSEQTKIFAAPQSASPPPATLLREKAQEKTSVPIAQPAPVSILEAPPAVAKTSSWKLVLTGAVGGAVVAASLWLGLRSSKAPPVTPTRTEQPAPATQHPAQPAAVPQPVPLAGTRSTPVRAPETPVKQTTKQVGETPKPAAAAQPSDTATTSKSPASPAVESASAPPVQPAVSAPKDVTPAPPPQPVPTRAQEDQPKAQADHVKAAEEEQAKRLAEEQARGARLVEVDAISRVLRDYQAAYERKDLAALQAIWPTIPKPVLDGIRSSFRDASEVSMNLHSLSDPKVSGSIATVVCDRSLRQVILKRVLQASGRVTIVLNKTPAGWTIQSVVSVNQ